MICMRLSILIALVLLMVSDKQLVSADIQIVNEPILVTSNQTIDGNSYRLADHANCPVIIVGDPFSLAVTNVVISNVTIDGNRINQDRELYKATAFGPVNNNGIIIQNARNVLLTNVTIRNCRSGGLVTTCFVSQLRVEDLEVSNNHYDGLACYHTTDSTFTNITSHHNLAAGLSFDLGFNRNQLNNVLLYNNNIGIFMRDSSFNRFSTVWIKKTATYELFLSPINDATNTDSSYNHFDGLLLESVRIHDIGNVGNRFK